MEFFSIEAYGRNLGVEIDCHEGNYFVKLADYEKLHKESVTLEDYMLEELEEFRKLYDAFHDMDECNGLLDADMASVVLQALKFSNKVLKRGIASGC